MVENGIATGIDRLQEFSKTINFEEEPAPFSEGTQLKYNIFLNELYKEDEGRLKEEPYEETPPAPGFAPAGFILEPFQSRVRDLTTVEEVEQLEKEAHEQLLKKFDEEDLAREELEAHFNGPKFDNNPYFGQSDKEEGFLED